MTGTWRAWHCRGGAAAVEFALMLPLMLTTILVAVESGRALWLHNTLQFASEEAARHVMVHPDAADADVADLALSRLPNIPPGEVGVSVTREVANGTDFVTVRLTIPFRPLAGLLPPDLLLLEGEARVPLPQ